MARPTIAVPVKAVPLGAPLVALDAGGAWREPAEWRLDPLNEVTLEWAVRAVEAGDAAAALAVAVGDGAGVEAALRLALARGAGEARLIAPAAAQPDVASTAALLAAFAREAGASLVACGYESYDGSSGALPGALAAALGWPLVSRAREARVEDGALRARRSGQDGADGVEVELPAVVSFVEGEIVPRHPRLASVMATRNAAIPALAAAELLPDGPAGAWTGGLVALTPAPARERATQVLDAQAGVPALAALLRDAAPVAAEGAR